MPHTKALRDQLATFIDFGEAHATADDAMADLELELQGTRPKGVKHSPWELLEHIRLTQHDILDFCVNSQYETLEWPAEYWPKAAAPPDAAAWKTSVASFRADRDALRALATDASRTDLFSAIPHGDGQTYLRELLLAQDHLSYHTGQLILVRQMLGAWHPDK
ncbi:MAG: DinB family protein [Gemmatimonadaceae bacterium]